MRKLVRVDSEAEEELSAAAAWYEQKRPGLSADFLASIHEAIAQVQHLPESGSRFPNVPDHLGVRRVLVQRFPYSIVYMDLEDEIRVLAFAHSRRRPGYWRGR